MQAMVLLSCVMQEDRTATIQDKTTRLAAIRERVERFVDGGGDLKSPEAASLGVEFIMAFADIAKEFGYEIVKPTDKK